jgi:hypothetical protein
MYSEIIKTKIRERKLSHTSFTLIEMIIVLAIIIGLVAILIAVLKPSKMLQGLRDTQRIADLKKIVDSITYYETENYGLLSFYGTPTLVYISLPDTDASCSSWLNQLPTLPIGYGYRCSATPTNIDGTGWIPINFSASSLVNLQKLPIDPINKPPYYYTYVVGGSYELTAKLEKDENNGPNSISAKDNGSSNYIYERGTNKNITPIAIEEGSKRGGPLVLYLPFDEGSNPNTTAYDYSGNGNNGTLYNFDWTATSGWTTGKVNKALVFDGVDDWVEVPDSASLSPTNAVTVEAWIKSSVGKSNLGVITKGPYTLDYDYMLYLTGDGTNVSFYMKDSAGNYDYVGGNFSWSDGVWHHYVGMFDGDWLYIYIDSALKFSKNTALTNIRNSTNPLLIGRGWGNFLNGIIDDVRIYNRALSADEIKALYRAVSRTRTKFGSGSYTELRSGIGLWFRTLYDATK